VAVAAPRRRADGDKYRVGLGDRRGKVRGKIQTPGLYIGRNQRIEAGLENRNFPRRKASILPPSLSTQVTW